MLINKLGDRLKACLTETGLTQTELAEKIGVSRQSLIITMETNEVKKLDTFLEICKVLRVPAESLLEDIYFGEETELKKPSRTVLEVNCKVEKGKVLKRAFIVPYHHNETLGYLEVWFNPGENLDYLEIDNVFLPYLFKDTRVFKGSDFQDVMISLASYFLGVVFVCQKLGEKEEIVDGAPYITINSESGLSLNQLYFDKKTNKIDFKMESDGEEEGSIMYSLPREKVYEIWKPVAVIKEPLSFHYKNTHEISINPDLATTRDKG